MYNLNSLGFTILPHERRRRMEIIYRSLHRLFLTISVMLIYFASCVFLFQAYEHDMYGKEYVYIALHDLPRFGRIKISRGSCNPVQIRTAANGLFSFVNRHVRSNTDIVGITGRVSSS